MALVDVGGILIPPSRGTVGTPSFASILIDASGEMAGVVIKNFPKSGNIRKLGFRTGTIAQCTNGLDIAVQGVSATTGLPDGANYGGSSPKIGQAVASNTWYWSQLVTDAAVTIGNTISVVFSFTNFAASDSVNLNLIMQLSGHRTNNYGVQYVASWAKTTGAQGYATNLGIELDTGEIINLTLINMTAFSNITETTYSDSSNPDRRGNRFKLNHPLRAWGVWTHTRLDNDAEILIYDSDGVTVLRTIAHDKDVIGSTVGPFFYPFAEGAWTPTINTWYRQVIHATTTSSIRSYHFSVTDDGANKAMASEPYSDDIHATSCNGAPTVEGDWTQVVTDRYLMGLVVDQLDDGAGSGGGSGWFGGE
jgi:hypothetical protein